MDRYTFLAMGRRRVWLIGAQLTLIALLIGCALLAPGVKDIVLLGGIGFAVNVATTFQDVAVDGSRWISWRRRSAPAPAE
jgi:PAT family beta-lactamase induction signal transducer AmpG